MKNLECDINVPTVYLIVDVHDHFKSKTPVYRGTVTFILCLKFSFISLKVIKANVYILMSFTVSKLADHGS